MLIKNLLHQPLELDFDKDTVIRFNPRETKEVPDKLKETATFKRNEKDLQIVAQPKKVKDEVIKDVQPK